MSKVLLEIGGHFGRENGRSIVALSKCSFSVETVASAERCKISLLEFEQHLRKRPAAATLYEWANIVQDELSFEFDVQWYDHAYFEERKNAYLVGAHHLALQRFGLVPSDLHVEHRPVFDVVKL